MVNSIIYVESNFSYTKKGPSNLIKWKAVSEKIQQVINFEYLNKDKTQAIKKITLSPYTQFLSFHSFFRLLFNELTKLSQLQTENSRIPELYYAFVSEIIDIGLEGFQQPDQLNKALKTLVESLSNQENIPSNLDHTFWSLIKDCLIDTSFHYQSLHKLLNFENQQEKIPIQAGHLFLGLKNIFNNLNLITPIVEEKYRSSFPRFSNERIGAKPFQENIAIGLGTLLLLKKFQIKFHQLLYKTTLENVSGNRINEMIDESIIILDRFGNDYKKQIGLFAHYSDTNRETLEHIYTGCIEILSPEDKLLENQARLIEFIPTLIPLIGPLLDNNFTIQDIKTLADYYKTSNHLHKVIFKTISQPLLDIGCIVKYLSKAELSDEQFDQLILQEDIPLIYFPTPTSAVTENLDRLKLHSPYIGPKKIAKVSVSRFTKPSPQKEASASAVPVPIPLSIPLTKRFPPLVQMQEVHASLQHTALYLDDIDALESFPPSTFKCVITCNSLYRLWEQKFRNEIYTTQSKDIKEHHLISLGKQIDQTKLAPIKTLIEKLSGAHMWTEQMFESYHNWKNSYRPIPPILKEIYTLFKKQDKADYDFEQLVEETLEGIDHFFESPAYPAQENIPLQLEGFEKIRPIETPLARLVKKINPKTPLGYKLLEAQKDLKLLNQLEEILKNAITSSQLPLLVRMSAKLHHGILQHLLQAIYLANNYEEKREHDLLTLVKSIRWKKKLAPSLLQELGAAYNDLHRLSNYPFDATTIQSDWHQAILESLVIRADPSLINGFHYQNGVIKIGTIDVHPNNLSLEKISNQLKNSKDLLSKTLPFLFEELSDAINN